MEDAQARRVQAWIDGYVRAWDSNDPADIRALFTQDAAYFSEPYSRSWRGQDEIVRQWLDPKDEPGQARFSWHPLAVTSEVAIIQAEVAYPGRATPTATCGSSASTPRAAAMSSPSGGCATRSPTSQLLSPQTSRRPAPQIPPG
jgi:ketosteroid isomerase-like protein